MAALALRLIAPLADVVFHTAGTTTRMHTGRCTVINGVASYPEHGAGREAPLRTADAALYRAKHRGRNVVASANDCADTKLSAEHVQT
ncbi:MAG TPA: hypothetical protein VFQ95_01880 [Rhodanobacteraceae bacterium]|nr:hypothetical protein [Rhodanobacteraceae bacterium]